MWNVTKKDIERIRTIDKEKMAATLAITILVAKGYCDGCKYHKHCQSDYRFELPIDAICTIIKYKIIKILHEGEE